MEGFANKERNPLNRFLMQALSSKITALVLIGGFGLALLLYLGKKYPSTGSASVDEAPAFHEGALEGSAKRENVVTNAQGQGRPDAQPEIFSDKQNASIDPVALSYKQRLALGREEDKARRHSDEFKKKVEANTRETVSRQYAKIFERLALTPEIASEVIDIIVDMRTVSLELRNTAETQGVRLSTSQLATLRDAAQSDMMKEIQSVLGEEGFRDFKYYNDTLTERAEINQLADRLRNYDTRLTDSQTEAFISRLAAERAEIRRLNGGTMPKQESNKARWERYDKIVNSLESELSQNQVQKFRQLFKETQLLDDPAKIL